MNFNQASAKLKGYCQRRLTNKLTLNPLFGKTANTQRSPEYAGRVLSARRRELRSLQQGFPAGDESVHQGAPGNV